LARHLAALLAPQLDDEAQMLEALDGALRFIALHELGHALVDQLQLPVTGREEDAVDQFAIWLMLADGDSAGVLSAASVFAGEVSGSQDVAAAHSLDSQRYFNMLCWVYGSDAGWRETLVEDWALPADRATQCVGEYAQLGRSWGRLLAAHAPKPAPSTTADAIVADDKQVAGTGDKRDKRSDTDPSGQNLPLQPAKQAADAETAAPPPSPDSPASAPPTGPPAR
jgi:hypothetical protein